MLKQILLILLITINISTADDVLMLVPFGSLSHKILFNSLAEELGKNGHNITLISVFKPTENYQNVTEIVLQAMSDLNKRLMDGHIKVGKEGITYSVMKSFGEITGQLCENFFQTRIMQQWLESKKQFAAVIIDGVMAECLIPVSYLLSPAVVLFNTAHLFPWVSLPLNIPTPYSFIPNIFEALTPKMNFWQRMHNAYSHEKSRLMHYNLIYPPMDAAVQRHFPKVKTILSALADVNLVLVNADPVISSLRVNMPTVVNVGGLHLTPKKPLPQDLLDYVESAGENGVVLFSLGSIFDALLTPEQVNMFLKAFSKIKYQVIWKYKKKLENVPKNVKIVGWTPQIDLLAHKNVRVFITHAGLLSLQEAFYHQVPTVTIPVFADQPQNSVYLASINATVALTWDTLTVGKIIDAVTKAAEDETLRKNVQRISKTFKHVPIPPLKKAVYWVEYVMRHKGANHLQSTAKKLNIIEYFLIDVVFFLIFVVVSVFGLLWTCFRHFKTSK